MAVTKFGVIVASGSAQIRRYVYPSVSNVELNNPALLGLGETIIQVGTGPYPNAAAWLAAVNAAVQTAMGKPPGDPTCCVLDQTNTVVNLIMADATLDSLPNVTLIQAYAKIPVGSTYDPQTTLFTAPGYMIPGGVSKADGSAIAAVVVSPTVILRP